MKKLYHVQGLSVDVEEWFYWPTLDKELIFKKYYSSQEPCTDVVEAVEKLLNLFEKYKIKATFFVLGNVAKKYPETLKLISSFGQEVASHGMSHKKINQMSDEENGIDIERSLKILSKGKTKVIGYRSPVFSLSSSLIPILEEKNFLYDSSLNPCLKILGWYGHPTARLSIYRPSKLDIYKNNPKGKIVEIPLAAHPYLRIPAAGGWYLRNLGLWWIKSAVNSLIKKKIICSYYIHPWEVSDNNPKNIKEVPFHTFRKCGTETLELMEDFIKWCQKKSITLTSLGEIARKYTERKQIS